MTASPSLRTGTSKLILTGLIAATASLTLTAASQAQEGTGGISPFFHTVDGQFSGGLVGGVPQGEWSDTTAAAFNSTVGGTATPTTLGDPLANSLLFAGLGRRSAASDISLHLMYDFLPRTLLGGGPVQPGEIVSSITFQVTLAGQATGERTPISVIFQGHQTLPLNGGAGGGVAGGFFDIFVDLGADGSIDGPAFGLGITGAADFGPSPLSSLPHLLVELDVPLRIPAGFSPPQGPFPGGGINPNTGLYDPDPVFWGGAAGGDGSGGADGGGASSHLQSSSSASFQIFGNGSIAVTPVPEPTSAALLLVGLGAFAARRRRPTAV